LVLRFLFDLCHRLAAADQLAHAVLDDFHLVATDLAEVDFVDFSHIYHLNLREYSQI